MPKPGYRHVLRCTGLQAIPSSAWDAIFRTSCAATGRNLCTCSTRRRSIVRCRLWSARILAGSELSRDSIAGADDLDPDRVAVIPNAAGGGFHPARREAAVAEVRRRFEVATAFSFSVGHLQPRKNHSGLIQAFAELIG